MRALHPLRLLTLAAALLVACDRNDPSITGSSVPPSPLFSVGGGSTGFSEEFTAATLDPAWEVRAYTGPRSWGLPLPANDYSLTANSGSLRYIASPMTHWEGFLNSYQTLPDWAIGCCALDPGLELHRVFDGTDWVLETKGTFYLSASNTRAFTFRVYFGDGGVGTYSVDFIRVRDDGPVYNAVHVPLRLKTGPDVINDMVKLEESLEYLPINPWTDGVTITTFQFRLQRAGGVLTASWSSDGITWTTGWTHDFGTALVGLQQRVVFGGLVWFNPAGAYADWDYVRLTPTTIPVAIDIKPGSNPNSINPASNGVIPVAVLTDAAFDAASLDVATVRFGATGAEAAPVHSAMEDVDGDGDLDLVLHFRAQQTGLACGATSASLTGKTAGGQSILGSDAVNTAGCR